MTADRPDLTPAEIAEELARRGAASKMAAFVRATKPDYDMQPYHRHVCDTLDRVVSGEVTRLIVTMPPRHGKSQLVSRQFPAYYIGHKPAAQIIATSYSFALSKTFSRDVRRLMQSDEYKWVFPDLELASDSGAVDRWETDAGGAYLSAGLSGSITGHGADLLIVDDPISNREEAESKVIRDKVWDFFTGSLYTRLHPGGRIIVMATRWNVDDLTGRLLRRSDLGEWEVIHYPAISEDGRALWPERYPLEELERTRSVIGSYDFESLYQGNPRPKQGAIAKRDWFEIVPDYPRDGRAVRAWDLAATAKRSADYIVGTKMVLKDGIYYIAHVYRDQISASRVERALHNTAVLDGVNCRVHVEQEPGATGKMAAASIIRALTGYSVRAEPSTGDKFTRALPFFAQAEAGNVRLVAGDWNEEWLDEVATFPGGRHDDQVDSASLAFNSLVRGGSGFCVT